MRNCYKYRGGIGVFDKDGKSIFDRDVNTLANNQIYLPTKSELNDPTEGFCNDYKIISLIEAFKQFSGDVKKQYQELLEKFAQIGIYSLSNNVTNELLWAYYGGGHTGFAIEYDIDILKESLNYNEKFQAIFDFDVDYSRNVPIADLTILHSKDIIQTLKTFLGTKSLSWKHEEEHRLIVEGKGLFDIDYRAITGIYFGYRMQKEQYLRNYLINRVMNEIDDVKLNGHKFKRLPGNANFSFKNINAAKLVEDMGNEGICISAGSACAAAGGKPSQVIMAINVQKEYAYGTVRITISHENTRDEIDRTVEIMKKLIKLQREQ